MFRLLAEVAGSIKSARTEYQLGRAQEQARDLYQYIVAMQSTNRDQEFEEWLDFAEYEAGFNGDLLDNVRVGSSIPTRGQLYTAMSTRLINIPGSPGYPLMRMLERFDDSVINLISNQIRDASALGYTNKELAKRIQDLAPSLGRQTATVARTATNHVSTQTRTLSMQENDDVIDGYEWVATLDSRTSLVCAARDGVIYKDFDKDPKPPAHFNCRSTITMVVNPEYDLAQFGSGIPEGTRPNKGPAGSRNLPASIRFGDWLHSQPRPFQEKILGKTRAELFRKGEFTLDKFVDSQGNVLTLRELGIEDATFNTPPPVTAPPVKIDDFGMGAINASDISTDNLNLSLSKLSPELRELVVKMPRPSSVTSPKNPNDAYYEPWRNKIVQGTVDFDPVFRHEYGHHIDLMVGKHLDNVVYSQVKEISQSRKFIRAFEADRKALGLQKTKDRGPMLNEIFRELYEKKQIELEPGVFADKWKSKGNNFGMISDVVDAMTHGHCYSKLGW